MEKHYIEPVLAQLISDWIVGFVAFDIMLKTHTAIIKSLNREVQCLIKCDPLVRPSHSQFSEDYRAHQKFCGLPDNTPATAPPVPLRIGFRCPNRNIIPQL